MEAERPIREHEFDEGCVCIHCGFDAVEWHHWKHNTHEGRASDLQSPACTGDSANG